MKMALMGRGLLMIIGKVMAVAVQGGSRISRLSHFAKSKSFGKIPSF